MSGAVPPVAGPPFMSRSSAAMRVRAICAFWPQHAARPQREQVPREDREEAHYHDDRDEFDECEACPRAHVPP
jgi:hypothetical protein